MSKYSISSVSGNSLSKFNIGSGGVTLNLIAGSFSHEDKSDLIFKSGPTSRRQSYFSKPSLIVTTSVRSCTSHYRNILSLEVMLRTISILRPWNRKRKSISGVALFRRYSFQNYFHTLSGYQ